MRDRGIHEPAGPDSGTPREGKGQLAAAGIVRNASLFSLYARTFHDPAKFKPGLHLLADNLSAGEVAALLERSSAAKKAKITFPEGWTRFDMAKRLEERRVVLARVF